MTAEIEPDSDPPALPGARRIAFERLRERTDELELIISGISLVALVSLPGWLLERLLGIEPHVEGSRAALTGITLNLAIGLSYTLAAAFLCHLAVRAYWVGLIGLKATFPDGIRWSNIRSLGPVARDYYKRRLVKLDSAIDGADRVASIIFMLVSLVAIATMWMGLLLVVIFTVAVAVASLFNASENAERAVLIGLTIAVMAVPMAVLVLDRGVMRWIHRGGALARWLAPVVERLVRVQDFFLPQRFVLPVQLSLEGNLPRHAFALLFGALITASALIGHLPRVAAPQFAVFGSYDYLDDAAVGAGLRSAHYENLRGLADRVVRVPLIASDMIAEPYLRVFLPYLPDRDNPVLRTRCPALASTAPRSECLAGLWTLSLDGVAVDATGFLTSERRDLGLRGLQGYVSMAGLSPGQHELLVVWNSQELEPGKRSAGEYRIPFWLAPAYELDLSVPGPVVPPATRADPATGRES